MLLRSWPRPPWFVRRFITPTSRFATSSRPSRRRAGSTGRKVRQANITGRYNRPYFASRRFLDGSFLFARHVLNLGGASPPRAVMTGTARLGQGVRREAESEGSRRRNSDSTNRNRIPSPKRLGNAAMDADARTVIRRREGKSGEARGKDSRLNLGDLDVCPDASGLPRRQRRGTGDEKSAEAVVVHCIVRFRRTYWRTKGRIRFCKEQLGRTR